MSSTVTVELTAEDAADVVAALRIAGSAQEQVARNLPRNMPEKAREATRVTLQRQADRFRKLTRNFPSLSPTSTS